MSARSPAGASGSGGGDPAATIARVPRATSRRPHLAPNPLKASKEEPKNLSKTAQDRTEICLKIASKMTCFNLPPARYKNPAQGAPRTPQDTTKRPRMAYEAPETPPKTPTRDPKTRQGRLPRRPVRGTQKAARHTQDAPRHDQDDPLGRQNAPIRRQNAPTLPRQE